MIGWKKLIDLYRFQVKIINEYTQQQDFFSFTGWLKLAPFFY